MASLKEKLRLLPVGNSGIGLATAKQFVNAEARTSSSRGA